MVISSLGQLINEVCKETVLTHGANDWKPYAGKTVAFDTTDGLRPFLEALGEKGPEWWSKFPHINTNLMAILKLTSQLLESSIKPIFVFSGEPSSLREAKVTRGYLAKKQHTDSQESMDFYRGLSRMGARVERECRTLMQLMGVPVVVSRGDAAAQCAQLVKEGRAHATFSNDLSALTFGSTLSVKNIVFPIFPELPVEEYNLDKILAALELDMTEFIDLSIVLGCSFCDGLGGVDRRELLSLIRKHGSIEKIIANESSLNITVPENWEYREAREMFTEPRVTDCKHLKLKWSVPDVEGIVKYLTENHELQEIAIRNILKTWS